MRDFALTYPQLMNQAMGSGFPEADLIRLRDGYELAQRLVDGLYRKEGAPFLCHLVRTASIVLVESDGRSLDLVLAALLHAAYFLSHFEGSRRRGPRTSDRAFLRVRIGDRAESLIHRYGTLPWNDADALRGYVENAANHGDEMRGLLLMKLANELEDHLDGAVVYAAEAASDPYVRYGTRYIELAERLGHGRLAAELREAFERCGRSVVPDVVVMHRRGSYELASRLWTANIVERLGSSLRRSYLTPRGERRGR